MGAPPTLRCTGSSRLRQLLQLLSLGRNRLLLINRTERLPFNCPSCTFTLSCRLYGALDCRELQWSLPTAWRRWWRAARESTVLITPIPRSARLRAGSKTAQDPFEYGRKPATLRAGSKTAGHHYGGNGARYCRASAGLALSNAFD